MVFLRQKITPSKPVRNAVAVEKSVCPTRNNIRASSIIPFNSVKVANARVRDFANELEEFEKDVRKNFEFLQRLLYEMNKISLYQSFGTATSEIANKIQRKRKIPLQMEIFKKNFQSSEIIQQIHDVESVVKLMYQGSCKL